MIVRWLDGPDASWRAAAADLAATGATVVATRPAAWLTRVPRGGGALTRLLGVDLARHDRLPSSRQATFAAQRVVVRTVAALGAGVDVDDVVLTRTPQGRLVVGDDRVRVSIGHAGDTSVAAVSRVAAIGVDIEPSDRDLLDPDATDLVTTPSERAALPVDHAARRGALLVVWTLKEAYTKAIGVGHRLDFAAFAVRPVDLRDAAGGFIERGSWTLESATLRPSDGPTFLVATASGPAG